jgi:hypothetical protein
MLVELGILGLVGLAVHQAVKPGPGVMTHERRLVFRHALDRTTPPSTPAQLLELADKFDSEGLPAYSEILRKRAAMRLRPPALKAQYREAFRKAMSSTDTVLIRNAAIAFEAQGLTENASKLRDYAVGLDASASIPVDPNEVVVAAPPAPPPPNGDDALEAEFAGPSNLIIAASHPAHVPPPPDSTPPDSTPPPPPSSPSP